MDNLMSADEPPETSIIRSLFAVSERASRTIMNLDYSMGLVAFATIAFMLHTESYAVSRHPRTWVRTMIWLDASAFFVFYLSDILRDFLPCAVYVKMRIASDAIWAAKDAFKFGYIVYRGLTILGNKRRWPVYATGAVSLVLYTVYIVQKYSILLEGPLWDCDTDDSEPWLALVVLYVFWAIVEIGVSLIVVFKMTRSLKRVRKANFAIETYSNYKKQEENRLLIACIGMLTVALVAIFYYFNDAAGSSLASNWRQHQKTQVTRIVFVSMQMFLLLANGKWVAITPSDKESSRADCNSEFTEIGTLI